MVFRLLSILMILLLLCLGACSVPHSEPNAGGRPPEAAEGDGEGREEDSERKLETKVRRTVAHELDVEVAQVTLDSTLAGDLDAEDADAASLIDRIEEKFGVSIPDQEAQKMKTVRDICNYIKAHRTK